ncbi:uncharacterized protein H6S33_006122 [Morchella sextelata]|uniref:uncharacterized protein n=1 Tax=Morchella sextelata TaxID=1174677 RepID=UPI001D043AEF|nr:uncharacterized protein H6S33_006122 [Morchella sextelata]KAH0614236.1 hypothetical protein H6S33_006122 [Morchella sextelata]
MRTKKISTVFFPACNICHHQRPCTRSAQPQPRPIVKLPSSHITHLKFLALRHVLSLPARHRFPLTVLETHILLPLPCGNEQTITLCCNDIFARINWCTKERSLVVGSELIAEEGVTECHALWGAYSDWLLEIVWMFPII